MGVCLLPYLYPKANHLAGVVLETPSEHLEEATTRAKGGISALGWASHSGKPDMPVPQSPPWMPGSSQVLSVPLADSRVLRELGIKRTGSSPIIVAEPLIKLRATAKGSKDYLFLM